ncbi:MAG TPA: nucleotidyltransferase domain-containing protein [Anaerolineae bacterium]
MAQGAFSVEMSATDWRKRLQAELDRYMDLLLAHVSPDKVILFGSLASDEVHLWSDIDLIVVTNTSARFLDRTKEMLQLLQPRVGLDILVYTPSEFERLLKERPFFQQEIADKGKVVYEREQAAADGSG